MAKEDNLIPGGHKLTKEEQSRAGKRSGEIRRLKKTFKMALIDALETEVKDETGNPTGKTYQDLVNIGLLKGAMEGNATNYKTILETIGEIEAEKTEVSVPTIKLEVVDNSNLESVLYDNKE